VIFTPASLEVDPLDGTSWVVDQYLPRVVHTLPDGSPLESLPAAGFGGGKIAGVSLEPGAAGCLWVSDPDAQRLLRVTRQGLPAGELPVAALGISDPADLAFDARDGTLYVADPLARSVFNILPIDGNADGMPDQAQLLDFFSTIPLGSDNPMGIALDPVSGHLYLSDPALDRVFELETSGAPITSFDTGSAGGGSITGLAWDGGAGDLVAADASRKILRLSSAGLLLALRNTAPFGTLSPQGITWDAATSTLLSVSGERKLIRFLPETAGAPGTIGGIDLLRQEWTTTFSSIAPVGVAVLPGSPDRYVVDNIQDRVYRVSPQGGTVGFFDTGPGGASSPSGIAAGPLGDFYLTDNGARRIVQMSAAGVGLGSFSTSPFKHKPQGEPLCNDPRGIAYDAVLDHFFVADFQAARVFEITLSGSFVASFSTLPAAPYPTDLAVDPIAGRITVSDSSGYYAEFTRSGGFLRKYAGVPSSVRLAGSTSVSVDPDTRVRVLSDPSQQAVYFVSPAGAALSQISLQPYGMLSPTGAAWLGPESRLFAVDDVSLRLYAITPGPDLAFGNADDVASWISIAAYGSNNPEGVVLNRGAGRVGWVDQSLGKLFWLTTSLGDAGVVNLVPAGATAPRGADQDPTSGFLFASDPVSGLIIADAAGGGGQSIPWISLGLVDPWGIGVSPAEAMAVVVDRAVPALKSVPLDEFFRPEVGGFDMQDNGTMTWQAAPVFSGYQVFRGALSALASGSLGGCWWAGSIPPVQDPEIPPAGEGWFYLVAGRNAAGVGDLGQSGDGSPRRLDAISPLCP
jgi:DNA-binding beta-propeller fold protein YncE